MTTNEELKESILATVDDLVINFMYYDRKEDEDLPVGAIEGAIVTGGVTVDEIVAKFREAMVGDG